MIDAQEVENVLVDCLYKDEELQAGAHDAIPDGAVIVEGIINTFGFEPGRLESHREQVKTWIGDLHPSFHKDGGGGWSFLNLPFVYDPEVEGELRQWGEQKSAENLYALAAGLGMAKTQLPRDLWSAFPGSVPYIVFDPEGGLNEDQSE